MMCMCSSVQIFVIERERQERRNLILFALSKRLNTKYDVLWQTKAETLQISMFVSLFL